MYMKTQQFTDIIDIQKCKYLFCMDDTELGQFCNNEADKAEYVKTVRKTLGDIIRNGNEEIRRVYKLSTCNRLYCDGNGLQNLKSDIKNFILKAGVKDYDMKNCNPQILLYLYKKHNLPHSHLEHYCVNRDNILNGAVITSKAGKNMVTKTDKKTVCALMNMDSPYLLNRKVIDDMISEVKSNRDKLIELESDVINPAMWSSKSYQNSDNPKSSVQCNIIWYYENYILQQVINRFRTQVVVPMFDGFNAMGECSIDIMNDISQQFAIQWCEKPLETGFVMGEVDEHLCAHLLSETKHNFVILPSDINDAYTFAKRISTYLKMDIVYCRGQWFVLRENNLWDDVAVVLPYIAKFLIQFVDAGRNYINHQLNTCVDEADYEKLRKLLSEQMKIYSKVSQENTFTRSVTKHLTVFLEDTTFTNVLNNTKNKLVFKNGVYDITTKKFRYGIVPSDKVSKTLDYNYEESDSTSKTDKEWIMKELYKVFCNQEQLDFYLSVIGYALLGTPQLNKHLYCMVGQLASNCKSTLFEVLTAILPCYVIKGDSELLERGCADKHKHMSVFGEYRIVWLDEMEDNKKINVKQVKVIADGGSYSNKELYKQKPKLFDITAKCFLLSNHTPEFDKSDKGGKRRYIHLQFDSEFITPEHPEYEETMMDDYTTRKFKADLHFEQKLVDKKMALVQILCDYAHNVYHQGLPAIPETFKNEKDYVMSSNEPFKEWFADAVEPCATGKLSKQEIISAYKNETGVSISDKSLIDKMKQLGFQSYNKALGDSNGSKWYNKDGSKSVDGVKMRGCFGGIAFKDSS